MIAPTTRDYIGTLMVNASVLAEEIRELIDSEQNWQVIGRMKISEIVDLEDEVIEMRNRIDQLRGDFANIQS